MINCAEMPVVIQAQQAENEDHQVVVEESSDFYDRAAMMILRNAPYWWSREDYVASALAQLNPVVPTSGKHLAYVSLPERVDDGLLHPYNFHLVLETQMASRVLMQNVLDLVYESGNEIPSIGGVEDLDPGMACVVCQPDASGQLHWHRGYVESEGHVAATEAHVLLVDRGDSCFVEFENIKPMLKVLAEVPPQAVRCQVFGLERTQLWKERIERFVNTIKKQQFKTLVEFNIYTENQIKEAYHVTLFDPDDPVDNIVDQFCYAYKRQSLPGDVLARVRGSALALMEQEALESDSDEGYKSHPNKPSAFRRGVKYRGDGAAAANADAANTAAQKQKRKREARARKRARKAEKRLLEDEDDDDLEGFPDMRSLLTEADRLEEEKRKEREQELMYATREDVDEEGHRTVCGKGIISEVFSSTGVITMSEFAEPIHIYPHKLHRFGWSTNLAHAFTPGQQVFVEAKLLPKSECVPIFEDYSVQEQPRESGGDAVDDNQQGTDSAAAEESQSNDATNEIQPETNVDESVKAEEVVEKEEEPMEWMTWKIQILKESPIAKRSGSGIITALNSTWGVIVSQKSTFRPDPMGPVCFAYDALCYDHRPNDWPYLKEILEVGQMVDFSALKTSTAIRGCEWLANSVSAVGELFEGVGQLVWYSDKAAFGFVSYIPSDSHSSAAPFDKDAIATSYDRYKKKPHRFPFDLDSCRQYLVRFSKPSIGFHRPFSSTSADIVGKWVRFRAARETGQRWSWRATLVEFIWPDIETASVAGFLTLPTAQVSGAFVNEADGKIDVAQLTSATQVLEPILSELIERAATMDQNFEEDNFEKPNVDAITFAVFN